MHPVHDYGMDLQFIHVKAGEWRKVESCWNDRYNQAVQALHGQDQLQMLVDPKILQHVAHHVTQMAWLTRLWIGLLLRCVRQQANLYLGMLVHPQELALGRWEPSTLLLRVRLMVILTLFASSLSL